MVSLIAGREEIIELLQCYKGLRCLWDTECKQYLVREVRHEGYAKLLVIFKKIPGLENATMEYMKKKLENMRTAYKRELKKIKRNTLQGRSHSPKLWYFQHMTFLDELEASLTEDEDDTNSPPRKKKRTIFQRNQEKWIGAAPVSAPIPSKEDIMGQSVGLQLRELSTLQQTIAQKLISDVIFYGKMNKLTEFSTVTLSTITQMPPSSTSPTNCQASASFRPIPILSQSQQFPTT